MNRYLTYEERKIIEALFKKGFSGSYIGKSIGRSKNAIIVELRRVGRADYTAEKGQRLAKNNNRSRIEKLKKVNIGKNKWFKIKERLSNLEMQVEILSEAIKKLLNNRASNEN